MHTSPRPGPDAVGLSSGFWCALECIVCYRAITSYARRSNEFSEVLSHVFRVCLAHFISCSPMRLLRTFPPLEAIPVVGIAVTLVRDLPADLYDELVRHPYDIQDP